MTEDEAAAKVRQRLSRWEAYLQESLAASQDGAFLNGHANGQRTEDAGAPTGASGSVPPAAFPTNGHGRDGVGADAACGSSSAGGIGQVLNGEVLTPLEGKVLDLEAEVERERARARLLAEAVAREQMLHAMTIEKTRHVPPATTSAPRTPGDGSAWSRLPLMMTALLFFGAFTVLVYLLLTW